MNSEYTSVAPISPWASGQDYREDLASFQQWEGLLLVSTAIPCYTLRCDSYQGDTDTLPSLPCFSQIYSKGDYPNLINNSLMHAPEKMCIDKRTSHCTMQSSWISLWAALCGKPPMQAEKWIHIHRRLLLVFSYSWADWVFWLICSIGASHPLPVSLCMELPQCVLGPSPAKASTWPVVWWKRRSAWR